ncbi:MAG TPA: hypothetical protein VJO72_13260, partial [Candidatus Dormibacteraeota bacterium]|nr:hypothetical protein [Candidatus Dormibacteraeota bacterium]
MGAARPLPDGAPSLAPILDSLRANRATGRLRVTSGSRQANLYLLFGHVYHAEGPAGTGDAALAEASAWSPVSVQLDARAKLPDTETIATSSTMPGDATAVTKQALLDQYASAPPVNTTDASRLVIPLSTSERLLRGGGGAIMVACAFMGVVYVQTVLVELMAASLGFLGVILVWWALTWKLILTPTGFEVVGMLTRKHRRWVDVSTFGVDIAMGRGLNYAVTFEDSNSFMVGSMEAKGRWRWALGSLGNSFAPRGMSAQEQAKLLEEWRARYSR